MTEYQNSKQYMDEENDEENASHVSLPEGIFIFLIVFTADLVEFLISLTGVGIIIAELINWGVGALIEFWVFMKGAKGFWKLASFPAGFIVDGIFGGILPVKTVTILITIYLINHPEKAEALNMAGKIMK